MNIIQSKMYSGIQAQKILGIKSRQYLIGYIKNKYLIALASGNGVGSRYMIRGSWLRDFKRRYDKGLVYTKQYSEEEIAKAIRETLSKINL